MQNRGKLVIIAIVGVGLLAASLSVLYHRQSGRQVLELWGTETALLVARAQEVRVLELRSADAAAPLDGDTPIQRLGIGGRFYLVAKAKDAAEARGLSNIRRAMVLDASYDWNAAGETNVPTWQYAMEFSEAGHHAMVLFDFESRRVGSTVNGQTAPLQPVAAADWRVFFAEQLDEVPAK
ncbi:MAG: hypothetical protein WD845_12085 [Pirellulales bacterium]